MTIQGKTNSGELYLQDRKNIKALEEALRNFNGLYELALNKPQRTKKQNDTIHALFKDFATQLNGMGIELKFISSSITPTVAKEFFVANYLGGKRTSDCTTEEIAYAVQHMIHDVNMKGGNLSISKKDFNTLTK